LHKLIIFVAKANDQAVRERKNNCYEFMDFHHL
jgi:hypothetical protein